LSTDAARTDALIAEALDHHRAGRTGEAEAALTLALASEPDHARAHAVHGAVRLGAGRFAEAAQSLGRAVELEPGLAPAHTQLGHARAALGQLDAALAAYDAALALDPRAADAHLGRGALLIAMGRPAEAAAAYDTLLRRAPGHPAARQRDAAREVVRSGRIAESQLQVARAARTAGRPAQALAVLERAAALHPDHAEVQAQLGWQHLLDGAPDAAVAPLRRAVALNPQAWRVLGYLGAALRRRAPDQALAAYDRALALHRDDVALHLNRGNLLLDLGRPAEAEAAFAAALALDPDHAEARLNLGRALFRQGRYEAALEPLGAVLAQPDAPAAAWRARAAVWSALERWPEALADYDTALAKAPDHAESWRGRGRALAELDVQAPVTPTTHQAALESFDRAVALDPGSAEARWSRGLIRLRLGRFREGWEDYAHRWEADSFVARSGGHTPAALRARFARGGTVADLRGRRVLLVTEQGVGDVLMFASILPDALAVAQSVALVCEPRLHRLFRASFPALALHGLDELPPAADVVLPIGELGRLFRAEAAAMPGGPYLTASSAARADWAARLAAMGEGLRVGVSWRGGLAYTGAAARSLSLSRLAPVLTAPGCRFVSVQYGDVAAELAAWNAGRETPVRPPPGDTADFEDLAALVQGLDLVVSVQTAVVHLAGALGTPCFAMVPRRPEWRYGLTGEAMPWYAAVRLFRQGPDGDWDPVIARVADAVRRRNAT
jgi:tetratricopeptide (TPR) repeat protein